MSTGKEKSMYKNRRDAGVADTKIDEIGKIDVTSTRYIFLRDIISQINASSYFYIIEANQSGQRQLLRNYLVFIDSAGVVDVQVFIFMKNGQWKKQVDKKNISCAIDGDLGKNFVEGFRGSNEDGLIVTVFDSNKDAKYCEYFIYGSLSRSSGFNQIIKVYNTANFLF